MKEFYNISHQDQQFFSKLRRWNAANSTLSTS